MIKLLSLFSGIGAFEKALTNLGIPFKLVNYCEIDKYASKAYCAIHGEDESKNLWDITKVDTDLLPEVDLITYGFPCQDISVAGKQAGMGEGTRSGLYSVAYRIIKGKMSKVAICENVKALVSKKFKADFEMILKDLEGLGYTNYWKVLNAKDYGIPQNRERVFIISIRGDHEPYEWPVGFDNGLRLKDFLEDKVDEKYYIDNDKTKKLLEQLDWNNKNKICCDMSIKEPKFKDIGNCILARYDCGITNQKSQGIAVVEPNVLRYERTEYGKQIRKEYESGLVDEKIGNMREPQPRTDGICNTLSTVQKDNILVVPCHDPKISNDYRIRKLTEIECYKLMGFTKEDALKVKAAGISNSQMYKQAGNSICVNVLDGIFKNIKEAAQDD